MGKMGLLCAVLLLCVGAAWGETREERLVKRCADHCADWTRETDEAARAHACAKCLKPEMDDLYTFMSRRAEDKAALRAGQERWEREAAAGFKDCRAFAAAYIRRMDELWAAPSIANTALDKREARAIAEEIVALSNTGALREYLLPPYNRKMDRPMVDRDFSLRLGQDGRLVPYRVVASGGTCHSSMFVRINPDGTKNWDARNEDWLFQTYNFPNYGLDEHPLLYRNRYFVVSTSWCPGDVNYVAEVRPDGRLWTLAVTETGGAEDVDLTPPANRPPVCGAILSGAARPLRWTMAARPENADSLPQRRTEATGGWSALEGDLDGDGVNEHVGGFHYVESAGCGGVVTSAFLLDAKRERVLDTALSRALQQIFSDWVRAPVNPLRAYQYEGRVYLEKADFHRICPHGGPARRVYQAERDGTVREICVFGRKETRSIPTGPLP